MITTKKIIALLVLALGLYFLLPATASYLAPLLNQLGSDATSSTPATAPPDSRSSSYATAVNDSGALNGKIIVVDPGHGGSNPGAVANNTFESANNLAVALMLQDKLTLAGAKVIMTRSTDRTVAPEGSTLRQELAARVDLAEKSNADMFISLHSNANVNSTIQGATTYYQSDHSSALALDVQNSLIAVTGATDKGILKANFYVIRTPSMASVLVEMGFLTNPAEALKLSNDSYRNQVATGVSMGIIQYFSQK